MSDNIIIIEEENKTIEYIIHTADVHIKRSDDKIKEYEEYFVNLYNSIKSNKQLKKDNTVIVVCGDILHDHDEINPISLKLVSDYIIILSKIAPCIFISGNHDISLGNETHNSLKSVLEQQLNTINKTFLLLDQRLYKYNNIIFGHTRFCKKPIVKSCKIKTNDYKCALYHGILSGTVDHGNKKFESKPEDNIKYLSVSDFSDYDLILLGDIHKHSFLSNNCAYPGSVLQQSYKEDMNKGYILWTLPKNKNKVSGKFIQVKHNYGQLKVLFDENGNCTTNIVYNNLPKNLSLDMGYQTLNEECIKRFCDELKKYDITICKKKEYYSGKVEFGNEIKVNGKKEELNELNTKEEIVNLLINIIKKRTKSITNNKINELRDIMINSLDNEKFSENSYKKQIKLLSLKITNLTAFTGENIINFNEFNTIMGIIAPNSYGKSAFIRCLIFSIYGECSYGEKYDMINVGHKSGESEIVLNVNGIKYKIKRILAKNSKVNMEVKETIEITEDGKTITGGTARQTKNIIQERFGNAYDFVFSSIIMQKSMYKGKSIGFAELDSKEKINMLCKTAHLDIIGDLCIDLKSSLNTCNRNMGAIKKKLKIYQKYGNNINEIKDYLQNEINKNATMLSDLNEEEYDYRNEINRLKLEINTIKTTINILNNELHELKDLKINQLKDLKINQSIDEILINLSNKKEQLEHDMNELINKNYSKELDKLGDINDIEKLFNENKIKRINKINKDIDEQKNKIKPVFENIEISNTDINQINQIIQDNEKQIKKLLILVNKKIITVEEINIKQYYEDVEKLSEQKKEIIKIEEELQDYNEKMEENLQNHEYDPECEYCMKNTITKEKIFINNKIKKMNDQVKKMKLTVNIDQKRLNKEEINVKKYEKYLKDIDEKNKNNKELDDLINVTQQQKIKKMQIENYNNKIEIEKKIKELEDQVLEIQREQNNQQKKYYEFVDLKYKSDISINEKEYEIKIINTQYSQLKEKSNIFIRKNEKNDELKEYDEELKTVLRDYDIIRNTQKKIEKKLLEYKTIYESFNPIYESIKDLQEEINNYEILVQNLDNDGVYDGIVQTLLPKFNEIVNTLFTRFGVRKVDMKYIKNKITNTRKIIINEKNNINTNVNGGHMSYLNNIVYRLALKQLNKFTGTNFMIIDEAFDAADKNNKEKMCDVIDYIGDINGKDGWTLIISHDDIIKNKFEGYLEIEMENETSKKISLRR